VIWPLVALVGIGAGVALGGAFAPEAAVVPLIQLGNTIVSGAIGAIVMTRKGRDRDTKETPIIGGGRG
jgi:hypothetical protein